MVFGWILVSCTWELKLESLGRIAAHIFWRLWAPLTPNSVCSAKALIWTSSSQYQPSCFTPYKAKLSQTGKKFCILLKTWCSCSNRVAKQRLPAGAKGMENFSYDDCSCDGQFVIYSSLDVFLTPLVGPAPSPAPPSPMKADSAGHRVLLPFGMPAGPHQKLLSGTSLSFLHSSPSFPPHGGLWAPYISRVRRKGQNISGTVGKPILSEVRNKPEETGGFCSTECGVNCH